MKEAEVALRIRVKHLKTQPVDISAAADCNMADDPAAGKPGWTRQGAGNDFSTFNARKISVYGVDFLIPDRKVIAVGGEQRKIRKECRLKLPETKGMKALHILQNCAWPTTGAVGSITVCYKDGSQEKITVSDGKTEMIFQIENTRVFVNEVRHGVIVAPSINNSRTFIPLRFVSEQLGYKVSWDGDTQTITIEK